MRPVKEYGKLVTKPGLRRSLVEIFLLFFLVIILTASFFYMAGEEFMLDRFRSGEMLETIPVPPGNIEPIIDKALDNTFHDIAKDNPAIGDWLLNDIKAGYKEHLDKDSLDRSIIDHYKYILKTESDDSIYIAKIEPKTRWDLASPDVSPARFFSAFMNKPEVLLIPILLIFLAFLMAPRILKPVKKLTTAAETLTKGDLDTEIISDEIDEIGILGSTLDNMRLSLKEKILELQNTAHELAIELNEKNLIIEKARLLQQSFFPKYMEKGSIKLSTGFMPCEQVGGDFFDIKEISPGKIAFIIGDVEGHGVVSSFNMMSILTVFRLKCRENPDPAVIVHEINEMIFAQRLDKDRLYSATAIIGLIDDNLKKITLVNAGHPNPIIWRNDEKKIEEITTGNPLLGIQQNYSFESTSLNIGEYDKMLLFTDGLIWCENQHGEYFGVDRLKELLTKNHDLQSGNLVEFISEQVKRFKVIHPEKDDDILISVFSFEGAAWSYFQIPPDSKETLIKEIMNNLEKVEVPNDIISDFHLALDELITNAVIHGNQNDPQKKVYVKYMVNTNEIRMQVRDEGEGFERNSDIFHLNRDRIYEPGKRGVYLVKSLMDEMFFNEKGNEVTIAKYLNGDNW